MAQDANPYAAPEGELRVDRAEEYGEVRVFSAEGRLNRLRYIAYLIAAGIVVNLLDSAVVGALMATNGGQPSEAGMVFQGLTVVAMVWFAILLAIQRLHDFSASGWWSPLTIIPLVSLIFAVIPGIDGSNPYGPQPPPNSTAVFVLIGVGLAIPVLGMIAAIAIPTIAQM